MHLKNFVRLALVCAALMGLSVSRASAQALQTIYDLDPTNGAPIGGFLVSGSTLYGVTSADNPYDAPTCLFSMTTNGANFKVLWTFTNASGEEQVNPGLVLIGQNLYGTTANSGTNQTGSIFSISTNGTTFTTVYSFTGNGDGAYPSSPLTLISNAFYGVTGYGGPSQHGNIFKINTNGTSVVDLYDFTGNSDGAYPSDALVASNNVLYGVAEEGGSGGVGTVYSFNLVGSNFATLHQFDGMDDGSYPAYGLLLVSNMLYGTTPAGGSYDGGTIYAVGINGVNFTNAYVFTNGDDGGYPECSLAYNGTFIFGTALFGGPDENGSLYSITPGTYNFATLYNFEPDGGYSPVGSLLITNFYLYGTTTSGGNDDGTIFKVDLEEENAAIGVNLSPSVVAAGETVTETINITNLGPSSDGYVIVSNTLSPDWSNVQVVSQPGFSFAEGDSTVFYIGPMATNSSTSIVITAVASSSSESSEIDVISYTGYLNSDPGDTFTNLIVPVSGETLGVGVSANPPYPIVGSTVTYTINVTNLGPATNGNISLYEIFPDQFGTPSLVSAPSGPTYDGTGYTFDMGTLGLGQTATVVMSGFASTNGPVTNVAIASSSDLNSVPPATTNTLITTVYLIPPQIVNVVSTPSVNAAFLSWQTLSNAIVQVQYGTTPAYGSITALSGPSFNHTVLLTDLAYGQAYYFNILAAVGTNFYSLAGSFNTSNTLVLDTMDASFSGFWSEGSPSDPGIYNNGYFNVANGTAGGASSSATYIPNIPVGGYYDVSIWYPQGSDFCTNVPVYINGQTNTLVTSVNETINGGSWVPLATNVYFAQGASGNVVIYNNTGQTNSLVAANAMQWNYDPNQNAAAGIPPFWWLNYYFGTNNVNASNYFAAYVYGAAPNDPTNTPEMWVKFPASNVTTVSFAPYENGRLYQLQTATNLVKPNWITLTNIAVVDTNADDIFTNGTGYGVFALTGTNAKTTFFRLSAQLTQ